MINVQKMDHWLLACGIRDNLSGAGFIREAVNRYRPGISMTKELYPEIARAAQSTGSRVERSIRHAIETGFDRCGWSGEVMALFGNGIDPAKGKPTNSEFIARIARECSED